MRIGIDLMGSDHSPHALFDAVIQAAKLYPSLTLVVFATKEAGDLVRDLHQQIVSLGPLAAIEYVWAEEVISMRDDPVTAVRQKKQSSLVMGIKAIKTHHIDAFITAGNTGALMTSATLSLDPLPGMRRPALLAMLPTERAPMSVLDVGSSLLCKAEHLVNFARIGSAYQRIYHQIQRPRVALLNIGAESKKGTLEHRKAYQMLQDNANVDHFEFLGNVEGRDVFQGHVDVLVTDGFTGNVLLKTSEGVAFFILDFLRKSAVTSPSSHIQHLMQELQSHFSYAEYPGAMLLGVQGIIVKCHGDSSSRALFNAIKATVSYLERDLLQKLTKELEAPLSI